MNNNFEPLYAYDSKKRIKVWKVKVLDQLIKAEIVVESGLLNGNLTSRKTTITEGKNLDKVNATSPLEQAVSEAQSKWEKKKKEGYKSIQDIGGLLGYRGHNVISNEYSSSTPKLFILDKNDIEFTLDLFLKKYLPKINTDDNGALQPMKAQPYWKDNAKTKPRIPFPRIPFPCYIQPKINGVRCFAHIKRNKNGEFTAKLLSKKGLEYPILVDITNELIRLAWLSKEILPDEFYLDGELYIPNTILSYITSAVRVLGLMTQNVRFYCFDVAIPSNMEMIQKDRTALIFNLFKTYRTNSNSNKIDFVSTLRAFNQNDVDSMFDEYLRLGYEGLIARDPKATYKFGQRPQTMTKLKRRESDEFEIIDVIDSRNNPEIAIFVCANNTNEETFKVNPEGSVAQKKQYFKDRLQLIGKMLTVEFYERTITDVPFHAVGITIRDYE